MRLGQIRRTATLLLFAALACEVQSQTTTSGALAGTVVDQTNAVVSDAYRRRLLPCIGINVPEPHSRWPVFQVTLIGRFWVIAEVIFLAKIEFSDFRIPRHVVTWRNSLRFTSQLKVANCLIAHTLERKTGFWVLLPTWFT
jgi:hypothetical protein